MKLEIRGLTKRFGSFTANDHIDLDHRAGEIHCLLGENGAGKSTLMNMLYGLLDATEGEIVVDGEPVAFHSPSDAIEAGIGMVHQHFMLVPVFTVAENVMLGREQTSRARDPRPPQGRRRGSASSRSATASRSSPDTLVEFAARRRPAAGRDPQGPLPRGQGADPRRAHRGAHAAGDRRADGDHALAQGAGHVDHLHHPQAARGEGGRRPHHGHPAWQGRRHRLARCLGGRAGRDDGRPRGEARRRQGAGQARPGDAQGRGDDRGRPARPPGGQGRLVRGLRRRGARDRRGAGKRPDRADQGTARAGQARRRPDPDRRQRHQHPWPAGQPRARHRLHPRGPLPRRIRRLVHGPREPHPRPLQPRRVLPGPRAQARRHRRERRRADRGVRHPHRVGRVRRSRPCPEATSRRSSSPGSSPVH